MWPTSIAVRNRSAPPHSGQRSPSRGSRRSANRGSYSRPVSTPRRGQPWRFYAATLRLPERVLARAGGHQAVAAELAAPAPALRLDVVGLEPAAREDFLVGLAVRLEAAQHALLVPVEGVRVLHDEFAHPQQTS